VQDLTLVLSYGCRVAVPDCVCQLRASCARHSSFHDASLLLRAAWWHASSPVTFQVRQLFRWVTFFVRQCDTDTLVLIDTFVQWDRRRASANLAFSSQPLALPLKGLPNGRHKYTKRVHARDHACRVEHAECERFYSPEKALAGERPKPFGEALAVLEQTTLANCQQRLSSPNEHSSTIFVPSASF
jgi:hypothetical protein